MANIIDILNDARITVKNNDYVNWFYIAYQVSKNNMKKFTLALKIIKSYL